MFDLRLASILAMASLLASCGNAADPNVKEVDDFAARIGNGAQPSGGAVQSAVSTEAGSAEEPVPANSSPDPDTPTNGSDTAENNCAAPKVAPFYGRKADEPTQAAVMAAVAPQTNVRFIEAGSNMPEDAGSQRLNIMIDTIGVIRDARCG